MLKVLSIFEDGLGYDLTIFGAGPLPRDNGKSWHSEMVDALKRAINAGLLPKSIAYVSPERLPGSTPENFDYTNQADREQYWLARADSILYWMDRRLPATPGLTTNWEAGERHTLPWAFMGGPVNADKNRYPRKRWEDLGRTWADSPDEIVAQLSAWWAKNQSPPLSEALVPLQVRASEDFKAWLSVVEGAGNRLNDFEVLWTFGVGPGQRSLFFWASKVSVRVVAENRDKTNEYVFSRRPFSSTCLYSRDPDGDVRVLLAGEFRSPAGGIYWAPPAGSSNKPNKTPQQVAQEELAEETGLEFGLDQFRYVGSVRVSSLISAVETQLWSIEISPSNMDLVALLTKGKVFGVAEDSEITYPRVYKLSEIHGLVDSSTLGLVYRSILENREA